MFFYLSAESDKWVKVTDVSEGTERLNEYYVQASQIAPCTANDDVRRCVKITIQGASERVDDLGQVRLKIGDAPGGPYRTYERDTFGLITNGSTIRLTDFDPPPLVEAAAGRKVKAGR
jgi:hypothetical protein